MQMYPEEFPPHRRGDPLRRAEARVFAALKALDRPGFAYYEWQRDKQHRQLDFALWIEGVGRFGLEVKGGWYVLIRGVWYLKNRRTGQLERLSGSPLEQVSDATMSLHQEVTEKLGGSNYFTPTLLFPDLAWDPGHRRPGGAQPRAPDLGQRQSAGATAGHRHGGGGAIPAHRGGDPAGGIGGQRRAA